MQYQFITRLNLDIKKNKYFALLLYLFAPSIGNNMSGNVRIYSVSVEKYYHYLIRFLLIGLFYVS